MSRGVNRLETGAKVAIIGGGPAGSFFALYLLRYAGERGIEPDITIYEKRDFDKPGQNGCKGCAGILSPSLLKNLRELGMTIPEEIIQSRIERYAVHSPYATISISNPEMETQIVSVYRGSGPQEPRCDSIISFDKWLLGQVQKRGSKIENQTVTHIHIDQRPWVEAAGKKQQYDLVVMASGVNTKPIRVLGLDYIPPKTQTMAQDELYAGTAQVEASLGNAARAFLIPHSGLIFGTMVPKGRFINISVLRSGRRVVRVADFLSHPIVRSRLPEQYESACGCQPRAAVSSARNFYWDRFVTVGDAAVSRLYKDGIGSSLLTAREAARTVVHHGVSLQDFESYYHPLCRIIDRDNQWGRLLFWINDKIKNSRAFVWAQHRLIADEQNNVRRPQPFTKAAWGMFTGSYWYRDIIRMTLNPASLTKLFVTLIWEGVRGLFHKRPTSPRRVHVGGRKILILGSGFGGVYVLRRLVTSLNRNENVETTMISADNFFLFSPLLHEVAMGRIETRHIAYPIRRLQWRDRFNLVQASVEKIDLGARKVTTSMGTLGFDYLVLALGSIVDTSGLESKGGNVFVLKTLSDAMLIKNHIIGVFEQANMERNAERQKQLLTFVVCGAGYTGVQLVTELRSFIYGHLIRFYKTIDPAKVRIILAEMESKIVAELHPKLGAYVMKQLQQMDIEVRLRSRVTRVWNDNVEINGAEIIRASTIMWVAGVLANPRVAELDVETDTIGRVLVNEFMEVPGIRRVYAVGDCAHFKDPESGHPIPPRAHIAVRQAKIVAHNILADIRGRDRRSYRYSYPAEMVSLGSTKAVFRFHRLRIYGFAARIIWLVGYAFLVTGGYNRIRIMIDWLLSSVFGRDTTFISLRK